MLCVPHQKAVYRLPRISDDVDFDHNLVLTYYWNLSFVKSHIPGPIQDCGVDLGTFNNAFLSFI